MKPILRILLLLLITSSQVVGQQFQDTIRYAQLKEQILGTNVFNTLKLWKVDNDAFSQGYLLNGGTINVHGIEMYGLTGIEGAETATIRGSLYNVDASFKPIGEPIASGNTVVNRTAGYYYMMFSSPVTVSANYALVVDMISTNGVVRVYVTNPNSTHPYQESFTTLRSSSTGDKFLDIPTFTNNRSQFPDGPHNFDALISPIVSYEVDLSANLPDTSICLWNPLTFTMQPDNQGILKNRMYDYQEFMKYFGKSADSIYYWKMGDGSPISAGRSHTYTYSEPGQYQAEAILHAGFWQVYSKRDTIDITIRPDTAPVIELHPVNVQAIPGGKAVFSLSTPLATQFQWQIKKDSVYENIADGEIYEGTSTDSLTIKKVAPEMYGNVFRCVVSTDCSPEAYSSEASLSIAIRPQQIDIETSRIITYGDDVEAVTISSVGLPISYASSDSSVAFIDSGKISIKKVGQVIITATQEGNEYYHAADTVVQTIQISRKSVSISINDEVPITKVYDGSDSASLSSVPYALSGVITGDIITVRGVGTYTDANVAASKSITVRQLVLEGAQKDNYNLITDTLKLNGAITPKPVTVKLLATPAISKEYDGTNAAILAAGNRTLSGIVGNEDVSVSGTYTYNNATVGTGKAVSSTSLSLTGADKANYVLNTPTGSLVGSITAKPLTVTYLSTPAITKEYDGTNGAILAAGNRTLSGIVGNEDVSVSGTYTYNNATVGNEKAVSYTSLSLTGADKANYVLNTPTGSLVGSITAKPLTVTYLSTPAITKEYDGTNTAFLQSDNLKLNGVVGTDAVSVNGAAVYVDANAGTGKTVSINSMSLKGASAGNYTLSSTTGSTVGDITKRTIGITLSGTPAITKEYDGSNAATLQNANVVIAGVVNNDIVTVSGTGVYNDANAGASKTVSYSNLILSGSGSVNYKLPSSTPTTSGVITKKPITVTANNQTKVYGAGDPAFTYSVTGLLGSDQLQGQLTRTAGSNVNTYPIEIGTITGGNNYQISSFAPGVLSITPANLMVTVTDKTKQQGEANPVFTFSYTGLVNGDQPSNLQVLPQAQTAATNGSPIGYYDLHGSGAVSGNYTISYVGGRLTVLPAAGNSSIKAWTSSPSTMEIRIYSEIAQQSRITLYNNNGVPMRSVMKQLQPGINSLTMEVGSVSSGIYILNVQAGKFKESQKIKIR